MVASRSQTAGAGNVGVGSIATDSFGTGCRIRSEVV